MWSYTSRDGRLTARQEVLAFALVDNRTGARVELDTSGPLLAYGAALAYPRVWFGDFTYDWHGRKLKAAIRRALEEQPGDVLAAYFGQGR